MNIHISHNMSPFIPCPVAKAKCFCCLVLIVIAMMTTREGEGAGSRSRMAPTCDERETFAKAERQLFYRWTALYLYLVSHHSQEVLD